MTRLSAINLTIEYPLMSARPKAAAHSLSRHKVGSEIVDTGGRRAIRALDDVSFELAEGDRLGVVGHNGSGKSTLLMALAGIYKPVRGRIDAVGNVEALFNIKLGFRNEATGRRNIILRGLIHGLSKKEISDRIPEIIEFSELEDYIDLPLYTYSQGMTARLAFATATAFQPQILLLDEWLGAGDASFQERAAQRMKSVVSSAGIVVLASHAEGYVRAFCNKAVLLKAGKVAAFGPVDDVLERMKDI